MYRVEVRFFAEFSSASPPMLENHIPPNNGKKSLLWQYERPYIE
jgi:hypothetical protein